MNLVKRIENDRLIFWIILILLGFISMVFMWYLTPYGMGLVNDSVGYIGGARNILAGNGYSRLVGNGTTQFITNYPPLLSIVIAGISFPGIDALNSVWYLNIFLFAVNTVLVGLITRNITRSNIFAFIATIFFAVSEPIIISHAYAMSEPLYFFLFLTSLFVLSKYFEKGQTGLIILSGGVAGLSMLARYVGISLYATTFLALLIFTPQGRQKKKILKQKIKAIMIYTLSFLPFPLIWTIRNMVVSSSAANRQFIFHPISVDKIYEGVLNFWGWLLPETFGIIEKIWPIWGIVFIVMVILLIAAVVKISAKGNNNEDIKIILAWLFAVEGLVYLATLFLSLTFVDASPIFEHRILAPFEICLIVLISGALSWLWRRNKDVIKIITLVILFALFIFIAEDSLDVIPKLHMDGQGFASNLWKESQLIQKTSELPEGTLYSNKITAIYILTDRPAYIIPSPLNPATQQPRVNYEEDLLSIKDSVNAGDAFVIVFNYQDLVNDPEEQQWMTDLSEGMPAAVEYEEGVIFGKFQ